MRPFLLLLMFLAPAMSPIFAQKQLPASIQPYAVNWGYSLKQMFQAAGYEVPGPTAEFTWVPGIKTRSNEPRLDSTITYYGYDLNPQDSTPLLKNVYTYPEADVEVVTEYYFNVDHWTPLSRTTLVSDELGRMVDAFAMIYDEGTGTYLPDSRIVLHPHENSMTEVDSFFVSGWAPELKDWHRLLAVWNTFDDTGRLIESLSSTELFEFPIVFLDRYFYNTDNDLSAIESFNIDGEDVYPATREVFWYIDHLLMTATTMESDGASGFLTVSKKEYTYTPFRKEELLKSFEMDFEVNDWKLIHVLGYAYDDQERVSLKEENALTDNGSWDRTLDTYAYHVDEHLASLSTFTYDNVEDVWIPEDKTYYYYNETTAYEPVDPIKIEDLAMWPNPASGNVQLGLEGEASVHIYGQTGQLMKQVEINQQNGILDVSALPAGAYFVKAKSNDMYYSGKLIVQ